MNIYIRILTITCICSLLSPLQADKTLNAKAEKARMAAVSQSLASGSNDIVIFTRGAICGSCGVGIRLLLRKLDGIDRSKYKKGVELDVKNQLTYVALEPGVEPDVRAAFQAVYDSGYDPVHYYHHDGNGIARKTVQIDRED